MEKRGEKDPWLPLLEDLREAQLPRPTKLPPYQHWMRKHADLILEEYDRLHPDKTPMERGRDVNEHGCIARELFAALPPDQQEEEKAEAEETYSQEVVEYEALQDALDKTTAPPLEAQLRYVICANRGRY